MHLPQEVEDTVVITTAKVSAMRLMGQATSPVLAIIVGCWDIKRGTAVRLRLPGAGQRKESEVGVSAVGEDRAAVEEIVVSEMTA